jgi:hypothetical protein
MCPANTYCLAGASTPVPCSTKCGAGLYLTSNCSSTSDISCSPCPGSFMCPYGVPIPCAVDHYCPVGSSVQVPCPAGSYCNEGSITPTTCTAGNYCPAAITNMVYPIRIPIPCSYNQYCPNGSVTPSTCPAYTYCPTPNVSLPCPAGATCMPNRTNLMTFTLCPAGYRCAGNRAEPIPCFAGTYSVYGSSQCTPCGNGTYSSSAGSPVCTMCPLGYTTSPMYATLPSQCSCAQGYYKSA